MIIAIIILCKWVFGETPSGPFEQTKQSLHSLQAYYTRYNKVYTRTGVAVNYVCTRKSCSNYRRYEFREFCRSKRVNGIRRCRARKKKSNEITTRKNQAVRFRFFFFFPPLSFARKHTCRIHSTRTTVLND